jgi:hypothetical protein
MDQPTQIINQPSQSTGIPWFVKAIIILVVLIFIYIKARPYIYHVLDLVETIRNFFELIIKFSSKTATNAVDETSIGTKLVVNKIAKPVPKADYSRNKSGFCYVGEYKGVRSCVKIDNKTPCESKIYSTEQQCVNPELR